MKLGRRYRLTIELNDASEAIIIEYPLTLRFSIVRNSMASMNTANLMIYNLSKATRDRIFQDRFIERKFKKVILEAGYDQLSTIYIGTIFEANSYRTGADVITNITSRDGGFDITNTRSYKTLKSGTSITDACQSLIADFPNLSPGAIGKLYGEVKRGLVLDGNTYDNIQKLVNNSCFVDLHTVNILQNNEVIGDRVTVLSAETGLLDTPRRDESYLSVKTIFEPDIIIGELAELRSNVQQQYDGQYKITGISHEGVISGAVNGTLETKLSLLMPTIFGGWSHVSVGQNQTSKSA